MKTILSVDDDATILGCFRDVLSEKGYRVLTTDDPTRVPEFLDGQKIDLITLDIHMPQKNGIAVFEDLKKKNRVLPVLFVTAYPGSFAMTSSHMLHLWKDYFGDGNADILYKPFTVENLYQKVDLLIGPPDDPINP